MGNFGQSYPSENLSRDVVRLDTFLREAGFENYDDHDAVLDRAKEYFPNYPEMDVEAVVAALYQKEQEAAAHADESSNPDIR